MALVGAQFVNAVSPNPVGSLQAYAGASAPTGWLLCDNSEQPISTYPELYSVLGTTYGALTNGSGGAGSTHFRLPDLRGRMPVGAGNDGTTENNVARTRGSKGGDTRIGNHSHPYGSVTTSGGSVNAGGDIIWAVSGGNVVDKNGTGYLNTKAVGGGTGDNMPPFLVTNYIIKAVPDAPRSGLAYGSTPPIVTALPANPQFGEQATLYTSSGAYQPQQYMGGDGWQQVGTSKPPMCKLTRGSNQTITNNTVTVVAYDTADIDTDSMATTGASAKITANTAGVYAVGYTVLWGNTSSIAGYRQAWVTINGSGRYAGSTIYPLNSGTGAWFITGSDIVELSAGQYVDLRVVTSGGNETIGPFAGSPIAFYAYWIGAT